jgi:hypothetical protein
VGEKPLLSISTFVQVLFPQRDCSLEKRLRTVMFDSL